MSYTQFLYHIVFRTHKNERTINEDHEQELYAYIAGFVSNKNGNLLKIGGMPDHIHLLAAVPATLAFADFMRDLKISSSKWLKENTHFPIFNGWAREYAAFSYAFRDKELISNYINNQKDHHKVVSFADEYRAFLLENGMTIREEYLLIE